MTDIDALVNRFLAWRLPDDFNPDGGISYQRPNYHPSIDATPTGTNLLTFTQAKAMFEFLLAPALGAGGTRVAIIEECAKAIEPKYPRPCDCERCDCQNYGDAANVAAWDEAASLVAVIRALAAAPTTGETP